MKKSITKPTPRTPRTKKFAWKEALRMAVLLPVVIVGSGMTGAMIAYRLSQDTPEERILYVHFGVLCERNGGSVFVDYDYGVMGCDRPESWERLSTSTIDLPHAELI